MPSKGPPPKKKRKPLRRLGTEAPPVMARGDDPNNPLARLINEGPQPFSNYLTRQASLYGFAQEAADANQVPFMSLPIGMGQGGPDTRSFYEWGGPKGDRIEIQPEYFGSPEGARTTVRHEYSHAADQRRNKPKIGHSIETYRPQEARGLQGSGISARYNAGSDVGVGGANEYADEYLKSGPDQSVYVSFNPNPRLGKVRTPLHRLASTERNAQAALMRYKNPASYTGPRQASIY